MAETQRFVYRISTAEEWEELTKRGDTSGGELDKSTGCIHLSKLDQLGEGLVYEAVDESNTFPHFYGPSQSFAPLPLDAVTQAEKISLSDGKFSCRLLA
uniref:DUF952 domain-containing protein n=1 Tax=Kalanchoe fedtschenkoi TaxID=63787 RepID=A0A7N0TTF3_KALFE